MATALGNARPRGRGRGRMERLPGGGLPRGGRMPNPKQMPPKGMPGPGGRLPQTPGNGGTEAPAPGRGRGQRGVGAQGKGQGAANGKGIGVSGAAMPGPGGRQLAAKVASGAITQEQADRTMKQRQTLKKALGSDWREKLSVGGQSFAQVNKQLKANPGNAKLAAIRQKLVANRSKLLAGARSKAQGGGGTEAPEPGKKKKTGAGVE